MSLPNSDVTAWRKRFLERLFATCRVREALEEDRILLGQWTPAWYIGAKSLVCYRQAIGSVTDPLSLMAYGLSGKPNRPCMVAVIAERDNVGVSWLLGVDDTLCKSTLTPTSGNLKDFELGQKVGTSILNLYHSYGWQPPLTSILMLAELALVEVKLDPPSTIPQKAPAITVGSRKLRFPRE